MVEIIAIPRVFSCLFIFMSFATERNSLESLDEEIGEAVNPRLFHLLHLAPGKPLQTEEAEKPSQTLSTGANVM